MSSELTLQSPAKVNLSLRILGKRDDGYHDIVSVLQSVSLYDDVTIRVSDDGGGGIEVSTTSPDVPDGAGNLAYRAVSAFREHTGIDSAVSVEIVKKIPVGAGLGGGSSNAATVILGLNRLLGAGLHTEEMLGIAAGLGSDVPFFILDGPALAKGRGEILERVILPAYDYLLINPGFEVSTAWVYGNLDLTKNAEDNNLFNSDEAFKDARSVAQNLTNDLEKVVLERYPEVSGLKEALTGAGALGSLMSGSGPTVFGVFQDRESVEKAFASLEHKLNAGASIFMAVGL